LLALKPPLIVPNGEDILVMGPIERPEDVLSEDVVLTAPSAGRVVLLIMTEGDPVVEALKVELMTVEVELFPVAVAGSSSDDPASMPPELLVVVLR
jgi:hypothetical protein